MKFTINLFQNLEYGSIARGITNKAVALLMGCVINAMIL